MVKNSEILGENVQKKRNNDTEGLERIIYI